MKLFRTAYELAINPTLPLSQFKTLIKIQRKNGSRLIEGHDNGKAAREFKASKVNAVDEVFTGIYNLLKNSGNIKGEIKAAAKVWNITHYVLPKITGTRFIGHRRNAFTRFVDM